MWPSQTKNVNDNVFNRITRVSEAKTLTKHISCNCKCKFNCTTSDSDQKWNSDKCQCECNKYRSCKKDYSWNPNICICENSWFLINTVDNSVIACHAIINVIECLSTNVAKTA